MLPALECGFECSADAAARVGTISLRSCLIIGSGHADGGNCGQKDNHLRISNQSMNQEPGQLDQVFSFAAPNAHHHPPAVVYAQIK